VNQVCVPARAVALAEPANVLAKRATASRPERARSRRARYNRSLEFWVQRWRRRSKLVARTTSRPPASPTNLTPRRERPHRALTPRHSSSRAEKPQSIGQTDWDPHNGVSAKRPTCSGLAVARPKLRARWQAWGPPLAEPALRASGARRRPSAECRLQRLGWERRARRAASRREAREQPRLELRICSTKPSS